MGKKLQAGKANNNSSMVQGASLVECKHYSDVRTHARYPAGTAPLRWEILRLGELKVADRDGVILVRFGVEISKIHATSSRLLESTKIQGSNQNFPQKIFFLGFCVKLSSQRTV